MVSTPVTWEEVTACSRGGERLAFDADAAVRRVEANGDLFAPLLKMKQKLPRLRAAH